jgi:hypothetical protein
MHRIHLPSLVASSLFASALFSSSATAQQPICHRFNIPSAMTSYTTTIRVPKFDASGGDVLTRIDFTLSGRVDGAVFVENLDNHSHSVSSQFSGDFSLHRPDNSVILSGTPSQSFTDNLAAYDGTTDFHGPSGHSHTNLTDSFNVQASTPPPTSDLALFTGTGHITLTVDVVNTSAASGSPSLSTKFDQVADVSIDICYTFSKDCNGNGVPDDIDIQNGTSNDHNHDGVPDECQPFTKEFCEGDGSANGGAECPCHNNAPSGSPRGCLNGTGVGASLTSTGNPSVSHDTLVLHATNIPNGAGYWFQGTAMENGGNGSVFGNGLRCVGGSVVRVHKIPSGTNGGTLPGPGQPPIHILLGLNAGDTRYYQVWYRDPNGACGGSANTTNGEIVVWGL